MAVTTLRPDGTIASSPYYSLVGGGGTAHATTSDSSDTTYLQPTISGYVQFTLSFGTTSIPSTAVIKRITPRVRGKFGYNLLYYKVWVAGETNASSPYVENASGSFQTCAITGDLVTRTYTGGSLPGIFLDTPGKLPYQAIDGLTMQILWVATSGTSEGIHEVYLDVEYDVVPTTNTPTAANTTLTTRPTINFTYSDTDLAAMEAYRVKVFNAAQYGVGGFNPETATPEYDSGVVSSSAASGTVVSHVTTQDLINGTTYKAYVSVTDSGTHRRWTAYSASVSAPFTMALDTPPIPTLTITPELANQYGPRQVIAVNFQANLCSIYQASLETAPSGTEFISVSNATIAAASATNAFNGTKSLPVTAPAAANLQFQTGAQTSGAVAGFHRATAGQVYSAGFRVKSNAAGNGRTANVYIKWYNSSGTLLSTSTAGTGTTSSAGFTLISKVNVTAPASTAYAAILVEIVSAGLSDTHYFDTFGFNLGATWVWSLGGLTDTFAAYAQIARSVDGGLSWKTIGYLQSGGYSRYYWPTWLSADDQLSAGSAANNAQIPGGMQFNGWDWTCPPNTTVQYKARMMCNDTPTGGFGVTSDWCTPVTATNLVPTKFWLTDCITPQNNIPLAIDGELNSSAEEQSQQFRPLGRTRHIVLTDGFTGEEFDIALHFKTAAEWTAFEKIRKTGRALQLSSDMTDAWWVRLGNSRKVSLPYKVNRVSAPYRHVSVSAVEVDPPNES